MKRPTRLSTRAGDFSNCDRLSLVLADARRCTVQAVSGVETVNRRSNAVRRLTDLVERLLPRGGTAYTFDDAKRADADIQPRLDAYLEESAVKQLAVVPLTAPSERPTASDSQPLGAGRRIVSGDAAARDPSAR